MVEIRLLELMGRNNIRTITELSAKSGCCRKTISELLNKKTSSIHFETIARLCAALQCHPGDLFIQKGA